ncbi:HAD family hydrolase [Virgibacillus kekensis]|uniref:Phosphoserine phosphatase n=1 Tax=Virgibacillus kekensis TaxID=202261 RepID=A0ABV9DJP1_9BACI
MKAILFDLDDTLLWDKKSVDEAFAAACSVAADRFGLHPEVLEKNVRQNARDLYASYEIYEFTQMIGINPFEALWGDFNDEGEEFRELANIAPTYRMEAWTRGLRDTGIDNQALGRDLAETFRRARREKAFVFSDTFRALETLEREFRLALLTNGSPDLQETKLDMTPELRPYFEHIIISGAFGKGKPDPAIFTHALSRMKVHKEEALMVGDNLKTDILGAERAGIPSAWVNRRGEESGVIEPTYTIKSLDELPLLIERMS